MFSKYLIQNLVIIKKKEKFTVENPSTHHFNKVIKVKIIASIYQHC